MKTTKSLVESHLDRHMLQNVLSLRNWCKSYRESLRVLASTATLLAGGLFVFTSLTLADDKSADQQSFKTKNPNADQIQFFETSIRPLLADHCYQCHGDDTQEGELRLDSLQGMLDGGNAGPSIIPGKPSSSLLLTAVSYRDGELRMPPEERLTDRQIADLTRWIEMGASHPDSDQVEVNQSRDVIDIEAGRKHWAFQPIVEPQLPDDAGSHASPIDALVNAKLKQHQLTPVGKADKRTLIRRATFDLIGLPPTPAEIDAFLADETVDAFGRVVDRLLNSPHYGERWGRHWLDIARYADSNGLDENASHANAWRYRDYVIESFNQDKPYDQFLTEQLAGDLLDSDGDTAKNHERLIATGYLVLGPKVLAEVDEQKMEMDIVDEQIDTIGRGLMGLTLGCVRCHSHKFDPLEHADYYALAGIFKSTRTMESFEKVAKWNEVSIARSEDLKLKESHDQRIAAWKQKLDDRIRSEEAKLESPISEKEPVADLSGITPENAAANQADSEPAKPTGKETEVEKKFPESARAELKRLREEIKQLEDSAPVMPTAMAVNEGSVSDASIHIRGSHLTLGESIPRRFPRVLAGDDQPRLPADRSGRIEFARWLTNRNHPLTSRVMANRIWRWHFGKGIVATVDNFGIQGDPPTHPELLDWLAVQLMESGWSIKAMHREIMMSQTYQRCSQFDRNNTSIDGGNRYYWRSDVRRLEAEAIRDSILAISETIDRTIGGQLAKTPNRELVFNHTSNDQSNYDLQRRSVYLPVIRNHLYDMFQLFDYSDASVLSGNRDTSTVSPQALFLMNSDFVTDATKSMAQRLLSAQSGDEDRIRSIYERAYARLPSQSEVDRAMAFLAAYQSRLIDGSQRDDFAMEAWQALCQSIASSSEFVYVR